MSMSLSIDALLKTISSSDLADVCSLLNFADKKSKGFVFSSQGWLASSEKYALALPPALKASVLTDGEPPVLVDSHTHFNMLEERPAVLALLRAAFMNIHAVVVPLEPVQENRLYPVAFPKIREGAKALQDALLERFEHESGYEWFCARLRSLQIPEIYHLAGLHPLYADAWGLEVERNLKELLALPSAVGVGEIGYDYGPHGNVAPAQQKAVLERQYEYALELDMPVEFHLRSDAEDQISKAHQQAFDLVHHYGLPKKGAILHCFTGNRALVEQALELGFIIGFGGAVTFSRSDEIREAFLACPVQQIVFETDAPFMTPVPFRGFEAEPAHTAISAHFMARLRQEKLGEDPDELYRAQLENCKRIFGITLAGNSQSLG